MFWAHFFPLGKLLWIRNIYIYYICSVLLHNSYIGIGKIPCIILLCSASLAQIQEQRMIIKHSENTIKSSMKKIGRLAIAEWR
jgi:hypothetical protein